MPKFSKASTSLLREGILFLFLNVYALSYSCGPPIMKVDVKSPPNLMKKIQGVMIKQPQSYSFKGNLDFPRSLERRKADTSSDISFLRKRTQDILRLTSPTLLTSYLNASTDIYSAHENSTILPLISSRGMKACRKTFNFLIGAWSNSGEMEAPDKAHALLKRMEDLTWPWLRHGPMQVSTSSFQYGASFQPNIQSYNKVLSCFSRSGRFDAGTLAEELLHHMITISQEIMNRDPTYNQRGHRECVPSPNIDSFTHVMEAYANSGSLNAAHKAQRLYNQLEHMYLSSLGLHHDKETSSFNQWDNANFYDNKVPLRPTARLYNVLIYAWAKSEDPEAALMAQRCLDRMEEIQETIGRENLEVTTFHYNSVIHAWANHIQLQEGRKDNLPAVHAENILLRMERSYQQGNADARPNTISYNSCIDAWAKSGHETAAERAETLLNRMEDLYQSGINLNVKPNTRSYNAVINAHSKSRHVNAPLHAERLLDKMERLYMEGNIDVKPDIISFATVINAWAKSYTYGKADRVLKIFQRMNDLYLQGDMSVRPNVVLYNAVINACAYTMGDIPEQHRAIEIAQLMLSELDKSSHGKPDQITYGTFLKLCQNQMPHGDSRRRIVDIIFQKCCKDGQVGNFVLSQLKTVVHDNHHYTELVGRSIGDAIQLHDLPPEWYRNVIEGKLRRRLF